MELSEFKLQFDSRISRFLHRKIVAANDIAIGQEVHEQIRYIKTLLLSGGKRLRPFVAFEMYRLVGGSDRTAIMNAVLPLELFHLFALIHDDIIDHGEERHSVQSMPARILTSLEDRGRLGDIRHLANGQAMLTGDLLFNWAQESFPRTGFSEEALTKARDLFSQMVDEVIIGEMIDVDLTTYPKVELDKILHKTELKTARYTFVRPMQIGCVLGEGSEEMLNFCFEYGSALGMAFQIQDDLLDLTSSGEILEKSVLTDLLAYQPTIFTQYIFEHGTVAQSRELNQYMGKPLGNEDQKAVRNLFLESGALEYGKATMDKYLNKAEQLALTGDSLFKEKGRWAAFVTQVRNRTK